MTLSRGEEKQRQAQSFRQVPRVLASLASAIAGVMAMAMAGAMAMATTTAMAMA